MEISKNWCKVFTLENGAQVLVTKDFDSENEEDVYLIRIEVRFEEDGVFISPSIKLSYTDENKRNSKFDLVDLESAKSTFESLHGQMAEMIGDD